MAKNKQTDGQGAVETVVVAVPVPKLAPLPKMPKAARKPKPLHACACGCGGTTAGRFAPGHDSRLKGWALRVERGVVKLADIPDGERQAVQAHLKAITPTVANKPVAA